MDSVRRADIAGATGGNAGIPGILSIYRELERLDDDSIMRLLRNRLGLKDADIQFIKKIGKTGLINSRVLISVIIWIAIVLGYKVDYVNLVGDPETGEPLFITLYIRDCGSDEEQGLGSLVKMQMAREGLGDAAGRVAIVCKGAVYTWTG